MLIAYLNAHREAMGLITLLLSAFGFGLTIMLWSFIRKSKSEIANTLAHAYLSDAVLFLITAFFGMSGFYNANHTTWTVIYCIRPFALVYSIWALWRLYKTFRTIGAGD